MARLLIGPADGPGEESFDVTVCAAEWLTHRCRTEGVVSGLHHVIVDADTFDLRDLQTWLEKRVAPAEATSWTALTCQLGRIGSWEFDSYDESVKH